MRTLFRRVRDEKHQKTYITLAEMDDDYFAPAQGFYFETTDGSDFVSMGLVEDDNLVYKYGVEKKKVIEALKAVLKELEGQ
jgi:hypothetical protein